MGIPILVLEIAFGQYYETGGRWKYLVCTCTLFSIPLLYDSIETHHYVSFLSSSDVNVFGDIHCHLHGIGVSSIACGYMLVTYYSMLLSWVCNAFFDTFEETNFWAQEQVTGSQAKAYFYNEIIGMSTLGDDLYPTRLVGKNVGYSFLISMRRLWAQMDWSNYVLHSGLARCSPLCIPRTSSKSARQHEGVELYIHDSDWEVFSTKPDVWSKATSQVFFSLGITFGIMTAYCSHCKRSEPVFMNSIVIALSDGLYSFVAGFAVFATLGHLAFIENLENIEQLEYASFGLVFGSWPVTLVSTCYDKVVQYY